MMIVSIVHENQLKPYNNFKMMKIKRARAEINLESNA